jgi:hypothetical protein
MTNRLAPYKDTNTLHTISTWWYHAGITPATKRTFGDLFSSYTRAQLDDYNLSHILTVHQFAKCLTALHIMHLGGGTWRVADNWEPSEFKITRTVGDSEAASHAAK